MCSALSLHLNGLKGKVSLCTGCRATLWSHGHCGLQPVPTSLFHRPLTVIWPVLTKPLPSPLPRLLPLLLKLPKPCNLLVLLLFSCGHLPLVLGDELSLGLLSFPAIGCMLS